MILVYMIALSVVVGYARGGQPEALPGPRGAFGCLASGRRRAIKPRTQFGAQAAAAAVQYALLALFIFNRRFKAVWLMGAGRCHRACVIFTEAAAPLPRWSTIRRFPTL